VDRSLCATIDVMPGASLPVIYLVRHGETPWTITGQTTGRTDLPLTSHGEQEARELAPRLRDMQVSLVLTSPLLRARQTATLAGFPSAEPDPDLQEWDYGEYEGKRTLEIRAMRPSWRLFRDGCPSGETPDDVGGRADRVITRWRAQPGNAIVFGHKDFFRVLAARWIGLATSDGSRLWLAPASISVLGYDHGLDEPVIRQWNETP
jgi:broad specificity phosphatase PhoE